MTATECRYPGCHKPAITARGFCGLDCSITYGPEQRIVEMGVEDYKNHEDASKRLGRADENENAHPGYRCMGCGKKRFDKSIRRCVRCRRITMTEPTQVIPSPTGARRKHGAANNRNGT